MARDDVQLIRATAADVPAMADICYRAFGELLARHGLEPDFPNVEVVNGFLGAFCVRPDVYGVAAKRGGKIVGSNFVVCSDPVAGVGPITVEPGLQARGVGRALMRDVVEYAQSHHGLQVRLVQDGINAISLSLYTSLGFTVREPLALLTLTQTDGPAEGVRPVTDRDVESCDQLCRQIYRISRRNELAGVLAHGAAFGMRAFLRERGGRIVGYAVPGFFGWGIAETNDDLLAILRTGVRDLPPPVARFLCPSRNGDLFRAVLRSGGRAIRTLNLMALGPYEDPVGPWYPSIMY